jgi:predicted TIM-barrel fold metal-dependent hydrolase
MHAPVSRHFVIWTGAIAFLVGQSVNAEGQQPKVYDHHVHVLSPRLIGHWKSVGMRFSRPDETYSNPVQLLEHENLQKAFLISMAHLYVNEEFRSVIKAPADERRFVEAENDFIAECVAKSPKQFVGFYSVSPLSEYALAELERCRKSPNLTGLKLHLPACGIDLEEPSHRQRLAAVLSWACEHDVPVFMHYSSGERITAEKADRFWREVIGPHEGLELYLAHLGSVGGYNESSRNLIDAFARINEKEIEASKDKIYLELSAAIITEDSEEARKTSPERCKQLSEQMRELGIERFVFGSDYPVFSIAKTKAGLLESLNLTDEEKARLMDNASPRFRRD